ncbi:MAG: carboxypeptidase-like regulatory domain-containing protein [Saprospiraceae bacterium]|nr:carboxypeptidase-like regulatory domain-containing protein [Saprospiraceae bacterium]
MKTFFLTFSKSIALCILIIINVSAIFGQNTIKGTVIDAQTGEPLIGANIISKENSSSGTITDFDGNYSFEPAQAQLLSYFLMLDIHRWKRQ